MRTSPLLLLSLFPLLLTLLLVLLLLAVAGPTIRVHAAADTLASVLYDADDPLAQNDPFVKLIGANAAAAAWTNGLGTTGGTQTGAAAVDSVRAMKQQLIDRLRVPTHVNVVLVGFDGRAKDRFAVSEYELWQLLRGIKFPDHLHVLDGPTHTINVTVDYNFKILHADSSVQQRLSAAVQASLKKRPHFVPYDVVDNIIDSEFLKSQDFFTVYLLNLSVDLKSDQTYGYVEFPSSGEINVHVCPSNVWLGKDRYGWIDIGASSSSAGPTLGGDGVVTAQSTPNKDAYKMAHSFDKAGFLSSMAAFIFRVCEHAFHPSAQHLSVKDQDVTIEVIYISHDYSAQTSPLLDSLLDWDVVQTQLTPVHYSNRELRFKRTHLSKSEWEEALVLLRRATHSPSPQQNALVMDVDVEALHVFLQQASFLRNSAELQRSSAVVPVLVFDMGPSLQLRSAEPVTSFPDMIITAVSDQESYLSQYSCPSPLEPFQRHRQQRQDLTRPVMAALLQTVWGVAPPYLDWHSIRQELIVDYGLTPFMPFSNANTLSFNLRHGPNRVLLLKYVNDILDRLVPLMDSLLEADLELRDILNISSRVMFAARYRLLIAKLAEAAASMEFHNLHSALYYFRSAQHDVRATADLLAMRSQLYQQAECLPSSESDNKSGTLFRVVLRLVQFVLLLIALGMLWNIISAVALTLAAKGRRPATGSTGSKNLKHI